MAAAPAQHGAASAAARPLVDLLALEEGPPPPRRGRSRSDLADEAQRKPRGLRRSKSVVERLDAIALRAALFDRASVQDDWCPQDDLVLRSLAASKRRKPVGLSRVSKRVAEGLQDPCLLAAVAVSAGGGAVALGTSGASCGLVVGSTIGGLIGIVPAPLTLGLSIPAGLAAGGAVGVGVGALTCSGIGFVGGGVAGGVVYEYRDAIIDGILPLETTVGDEAGSHCSKAKALEETVCYGRDRALLALRGAAEAVSTAAGSAGAKASELRAGVCDLATSPRVQVTAVSAAGGAVALGTGGGIAGLAAGSTAGAAWGCVPALLTFGLSVPISAAVGGVTGLCAGAAIGSCSGFVGGGVVGCTAYNRRKDASRYVHRLVEYGRGLAPTSVGGTSARSCTAATGGTG